MRDYSAVNTSASANVTLGNDATFDVTPIAESSGVMMYIGDAMTLGFFSPDAVERMREALNDKKFDDFITQHRLAREQASMAPLPL